MTAHEAAHEEGEDANHQKGVSVTGHIDVHAHFVTEGYLRAAHEAGVDRPDGIPRWPHWSTDEALAQMDATGVEHAILSVSSPGVAFGEASSAVRLARQVNTEGAQISAEHQGRFGLFASLPLPDITSSIAELHYAMGELGASGVVLLTNYRGVYLGDGHFDPLFRELNDHKAVVFVHPTSPFCPESNGLEYPRPMLEFFFDTTRAIVNYILRGGARRFPDVRVIVPHAGAALPVLVDRVTGFVARDQSLSQYQDNEVGEDFSRLWYDLAGFAARQQSYAVRRMAGVNRLLYGSDFPFTSEKTAKNNMALLESESALTSGELAMTLRRNALELFPGLRGSQDGGP